MCVNVLCCSFYAKTDPKDVARVEEQTYVCSKEKSDAVPTPKEGMVCMLGNWRDPVDMDKELDEKFSGCMRGEVVGRGFGWWL